MPPWDAFTATEAEVRALVADPRWERLPVPARAEVIASRTLVTPDGDRWLFGAHARWHLHDPADGRWHLAPPPRGAHVRRAGHAAAVLPARVIPRGPDFAAEPGSTQAFVGPDVPAHVTEQIRVLVRAAGRRSELDFPLTAFDEILAGDVPSTVAAVWGTVMWCAYAPAFDGNERLLTVFGEYLRRPLPGDEWVRWVPAPPLLDLVRLVAERMRAGRHREALRLTAVMADTAQILLADARFRPRALALLTMVEPALNRPGLDEPAARRDDESLRRAWLERCPPRLGRALLVETDPRAHFCHTVYDLVEALSFTPDPARAAATLLADLSDSKGLLPGMLDHRLRHAYDELSRAGLTGTSAAEATQPDGFPVLGPAQPLPPPHRPTAGPTGPSHPPGHAQPTGGTASAGPGIPATGHFTGPAASGAGHPSGAWWDGRAGDPTGAGGGTATGRPAVSGPTGGPGGVRHPARESRAGERAPGAGAGPGHPRTGTGMPAAGTPRTPMPGTGMPGTGTHGTPMPGTGMPGTGTHGTDGTPVPGTPMPGSPVPGSPVPGTPGPGGAVPGGVGRVGGFKTRWGVSAVPAAARKAREALSRMPHRPVVSGFEIEPPDRASAAAVLGAAYAAGLAWRGVSGARVPDRGFAGQSALVLRIVHERDDIHP
ncbi:hypothetical protein [Nonomuraea indica]|uniref:hypothetical protein n=1 Tax=Nonomuraea indica TaxID=1581193 RepID=UPI0011845E31|nr:hypothetical protein [Nonomuraea indica]